MPVQPTTAKEPYPSCQIDPPFFTYTSYHEGLNAKKYVLNPKMLSSEKCHIFFDALGNDYLSVEEVIAKTLKLFTFHSSTPKSKEFERTYITVNGYPMWWCSFPMEYKDVCKRIGDTFKMTIKPTAQLVIALKESRDLLDSGVRIVIPPADHIISFSGMRPIPPSILRERSKWIEDRANDHHRLGLS